MALELARDYSNDFKLSRGGLKGLEVPTFLFNNYNNDLLLIINFKSRFSNFVNI